jgi:hypothetical protein
MDQIDRVWGVIYGVPYMGCDILGAICGVSYIGNWKSQVPNAKSEMRSSKCQMPNGPKCSDGLLAFEVRNPKFQMPHPKCQVPNPKFEMPNPKCEVPNAKCRYQPDMGCHIWGAIYGV